MFRRQLSNSVIYTLLQVVSAGSAFFLSWVVLFHGSDEQYALHASIIGLSSFAAGFMSSLLSYQIVQASLIYGHSFLPAATHVLTLLSSLTLIVSLSIAPLFSIQFVHISLIVMIGFCIALKDACFSYFISSSKGRPLIAAQSLQVLILFFLTVMVFPLGSQIDAVFSLSVYGLSISSAAAFGCFFVYKNYCKNSAMPFYGVLQIVLRNALWPALQHLSQSLRAYVYFFTSALLGSLQDIASIAAARMVVTPALLVVPTFSAILISEYTKRNLSKDIVSTLKLQKKTSVLMLSGLFSFGLIVLFAWPFFSERLLPSHYHHIGPLVLAWFVYAANFILRMSFEWVLRGGMRFKEVSSASVISAILSLPLSLGLFVAFGAVGVIYAMAILEALVMVILYRNMHRVLKRSDLVH